MNRLKIKKGIGIVIGLFILYLMLIVIHELSHIIVAIILGNPPYKIEIGFLNKGDLFSFAIAVCIKNLKPEVSLYIAPAGSLGAVIICIIGTYYGFRKKKIATTTLFYCFMIGEVFYWFIGSLFNIGDPHVLFWSFDNLGIVYNPHIFATIFFLIMILLFALETITILKMEEIK